MSCLQCLLSIVGNSTAVSTCQNTYDRELIIITLMIFFFKCRNIYIVYAQGCHSAGHTVPNFTCASDTSDGDSSTGLGATSSTLIIPTQSSIPTGSSNSSSSDGEGASGTATDGAIQLPMSRIMVLIGVITIATCIA